MYKWYWFLWKLKPRYIARLLKRMPVMCSPTDPYRSLVIGSRALSLPGYIRGQGCWNRLTDNNRRNLVCLTVVIVLSNDTGISVIKQLKKDVLPLHWRHNDHDSVSNHQPYGCLLNRLFGRRSKKISKLRVTGLCAGNSPGPVNSPHKGPVTRKMLPFDDVIIQWVALHVGDADL